MKACKNKKMNVKKLKYGKYNRWKNVGDDDEKWMNRFLEAGKGAENTKEKSRRCFKGRLIKEEREECKTSMNVGPLKPTSFLFLSKLAASCNRCIVGHE
jgi:hypothetical protein